MREKYNKENVILGPILPPEMEVAVPVPLSTETMKKRRMKVLKGMEQQGFDTLVIYADLEHGGNFEYLTGFVPRFEEAILVLHKDGKAFLLLGNEMLKMSEHSCIPAAPIHVPYFSLPDQPMDHTEPLDSLFGKAGIQSGKRIGLVGWKGFSKKLPSRSKIFDIPYYIVEAIKKAVNHETSMENATDIFIHSSFGARIQNNPNEIAHYEYGQVLASNGMIRAMNAIEVGKKEIEIASYLESQGQRNNVVTICSTGQRFVNGNLYPSNQKVQLGDRLSLTVGYKGGLVSRAGYAVEQKEQLPEEVQDYVERLAKPYFVAITTWLENIRVGVRGGDVYQWIENVLPQEKYGWHLNPGHLTSDEEWLSSPIYEGSEETIQSGMLIQLDIIPSMKPFSGVSAENGVLLADSKLREEIRRDYPDLYERIQRRRRYITHHLKIVLSPDVLPLSSTVAYYRPYLLNQQAAFSFQAL